MEGFIIKSLSGDFFVLGSDNKVYTCKVRGQIRNRKITPLPGDLVSFDYDASTDFSLINDIYSRKNSLVRPPVANVDIALIVMSTIKPNFDPYLVSKLVIAAEYNNIKPVIVLSKCEYSNNEIDLLLENYVTAGYDVIKVSSKENINIDKVLDIIKGKKVILCGQSAVGKSSLVNALLNTDMQEIGDFSEKLGRGKHQTRVTEFIKVGDGYIADSPGFSSLELKIDLPVYARLFKDFNVYASKCKYPNCLHINEPECGVKEAVKNGLVIQRRYDDYVHLFHEIKEGKHVWVKK